MYLVTFQHWVVTVLRTVPVSLRFIEFVRYEGTNNFILTVYSNAIPLHSRGLISHSNWKHLCECEPLKSPHTIENTVYKYKNT